MSHAATSPAAARPGARVHRPLAAGVAAAAAVLAAMVCVLLATPAAGQAAVVGIAPRVLNRELNRAQMQLRRRLARLPLLSGIELVRQPDSLILRVPTRLLFAPDGTTLRSGDASAALALTAAAQLLKRRPRLSAQVDVYTDNIGGESLNRALSEQRAEEVAAALRAAGVAARRLQAHGGGLQDALASNDTAQGRMENRRLEIVFEYAQLGDASKGSAPAASAPLEAAPPLSPGRATAPAGG